MKPDAFASKVPSYDFSDSGRAQERQLKSNPLLKRFSESRAELSRNPHRPLYHFSCPEGSITDPNGLCFWRGRWHLFYQSYPPEDPRQHWGHAVSDDLVRWRDLPYAIYPGPEERCYSGAALVEDERVIVMYHGTRAGNIVAESRDPLLLNWKKLGGKAAIPMNPELPYSERDKASWQDAAGKQLPFYIHDPCIWKKGGFYYSVSGGKEGRLPEGPGGKFVRVNFLFRSKDLMNWEYMHTFIEGDRFTMVGDDGACPYFWPLGGRHIFLFFSHMSGGQAFIGDYDRERDKFAAASHLRFNFGANFPSGVNAPSASPDGKGGVIVIFNMIPGIMTLPRRIELYGEEDLRVNPVSAVETLRRGRRKAGMKELPANREVVLDGISGRSLEITAEIEPRNSSVVEMNVLRSPGREEFTRISFFKERGYLNRDRRHYGGIESIISVDSSCSSLASGSPARPPETAPVVLDEGEPLKLRVFVDRSVVEVFVNGRQALAVRVYPSREDSAGVSLCSRGSSALLKSLDAWRMESIQVR